MRDRDIQKDHHTAEYWEYDPRIARRWNVDPKPTAWESPYLVNGGNPIFYTDPFGDFKGRFGAWLYSLGWGGKVGYNKVAKEWYVGKKIKYTGDGVGVASKVRYDWNGSNSPYNGSGWGHDARSMIALVFGVNGSASGLFGVGFNSILQNKSVQLTGDMLDKVKQDPRVIEIENSIIGLVKSDVERYGKMAFSLKRTYGAQLGGRRGSLNPFSSESAQTWQVAANPLTWVVRSVSINAQVDVTAAGAMHITYSFTDNLDLRPERGGKVYFGGSDAPLAGVGDLLTPNTYGGGSRPVGYNAVSSILGVPYHDIAGGNDKMKINATWTSDR